MSAFSVRLSTRDVVSTMLALNDIVEVLHVYKVDREVIDEIMPNVISIKSKITSESMKK